MSWLGWGSSTNPQYEELVEKACSPLNLPYPQSEDISVNLEITDMIRGKTVLPKPAMQSLKRRITSRNGRVQMYALSLVDTCIKNGGDHFLAEIASKEFVDDLAGQIKFAMTGAEVKQMALKYFQQWAIAFQAKKELSFLVDVYNEMKNSGIQFPPPPAALPAHLLETTTAPAWVDSDSCMRCRTAFTFTNRKHHCRNCGLVFDQACSSKTMPLPHFGITEPVRVCETCWTKSGKGKIPTGPPPAIPGRTLRSREDLDADLQRAIELSLADSQPGGRSIMGSEPPIARSNRVVEDDDEELRLAIEASLREMEKARPSAPTGQDEPEYRPLPTFDLAPREAETILTFSNTLDQMAAYGERDLRRFPQAHILYEQAYALGGKLQRNAEEKSTKQQMLAEMQAKLSEAVQLYGQVLDGQQAYSARRQQEAQQRQYQQRQYSQQYPQYQYDNRYAAPQPNGYAQQPYSSSPYASSSQPNLNAAAAPSLYPTMPAAQDPHWSPALQYAPYQPPHQPFRAESATPTLNTYPSQPYPQSADPYAQHSQSYIPQQYPPHADLQRHSSTRSLSAQHQGPVPQRQASSTYPSQPEQYASQGSAPPIDLASHPSASPRSIKSNLPAAPARSASYSSSTSHIASHLPTSPSTKHAPSQLPQQQTYALQSAWQQPEQHHQPQQQQAQQQEPVPQQNHLYSAASFPQAPAAVFPDAPLSEPQGLEKKEREEALLIEL